jgi:hypothetical protein
MQGRGNLSPVSLLCFERVPTLEGGNQQFIIQKNLGILKNLDGVTHPGLIC